MPWYVNFDGFSAITPTHERRDLARHAVRERRRVERQELHQLGPGDGVHGSGSMRPTSCPWPNTTGRVATSVIAERAVDVDAEHAERLGRRRLPRAVRRRPPPSARRRGRPASAPAITPSAPSLATSPGTACIHRVTSRVGPPTRSGRARHRRRRRRSSVGGDLGERPGQVDERDRVGRRAAPVDTDVVHRCSRGASNDPVIADLQRMIRLRGSRRSDQPLTRQVASIAGVLARAVLLERRRADALADRASSRAAALYGCDGVLRRSASARSNSSSTRRTASVWTSHPSWLAHTIASRSSGSARPSSDHRRRLHRLQRRSRIDGHAPGRRSRRSTEPSGPRATAAPWNSDSSNPLRVATASGANAIVEPSHAGRDVPRQAGLGRNVRVGALRPLGSRSLRRRDRGEMAVDHVVALAPLARERLHHRRRGQRQHRADGAQQRRARRGPRRTRRPGAVPSSGR